MKRKNWFVTLSCAMLLLAACSSNGGSAPGAQSGTGGGEQPAGETKTAPAEEKIELRMSWWGSQERHDKTLQAIELFEAKYPHITIVGEYSGFDGYFDKLNTQLAAGNAPDIIQLGGNIKEYYERGALAPLDEYLGDVLSVADLSESMIKEATFDGKYYGVTVGVSGTGILVNKRLFQEANVPLPPKEWTREEYNQLILTLSENLGEGIYGSYDLSGNKPAFTDFLASEGKQVYKDGKLDFTKEDMIRWFTMWDELRKANAIVPPEMQVANNPDAADKSLVVKGQVAMQYTSASQIFGFQQLTQDELGLLTSPNGPMGTGMYPPPSGQFMTVYGKSEHPKEAAMFIDFMVNNEEAATVLGNTRGVPPSEKVRELLSQTSSPVDKVLYDYISLSNEVASNFEYEIFPLDNEFVNLLRLTSEQIAFGQMSVEKAVDQFMVEAEKLLAKAKQ
ncbi:ABC transporter substrate-binding protein [Paenibacillus sp.]|uniref:ABC transporter substrate-binding protein n=1 Tax=Paenibacillus sp. TaxID=58172 RepID=UPI002D29C19A|nr:extracellular solute-binding protein [Paenibacillus sp.]HZG85699.1 extracellular solute-binding protein [Paenibacillus sp.]